ncbi:hypothetical protein AWR36_012955 [Microbulbifer flavimaris]|uniref:Lipoprotein n=1 Tax=Microbulbifer flavimaris TaxID=1781068 RepID=A0ABX4HYD7_9GAMM|nr:MULTISPECIES: hypothetical protein [Microbulbifer]KUJ81459.1 hypothetical protein AVO43_12930 [Microbulbifer sp. ZGT114]PCO04369.1 hypothetical protein AWR36_012955 [Microbulbifer flavimaris]
MITINNNRRLGRALCFAPLSLLLLAGCASESTAPIPGLSETFHTEIAANGAKRFTYTLEMRSPELPRPVTREDVNRARIQRETMLRTGQRPRGPRIDEMAFNRSLNQKLTETGFCRDGFFELDRTLFVGGGEVRGECRDGARR